MQALPAVDAEARSSDNPAAARRTVLVLTALLSLYLGSLALLVALDQITMVWKSLVIPALIAAAAITGRLRPFVADWSIFLGLVAVFESLRALIYAGVLLFERPVYMGYAIDAERLLFGEPSPIHAVQAFLGAGPEIHAADMWMGAAYASHFLAFLLFGLALWLLRPAAWGRFAIAMLVLMYSGLLGYLLVPTVPPWMAQEHYQMLPPFLGGAGKVFKGSLPALATAFDTNPIAAMPSMHCAFPALLALQAFRSFGRFGWVMSVYAAGVCTSTVYLGQHYLVDVLAGIALAVAVDQLVHHRGRLYDLAARAARRLRALPIRVHALATLLLVVLTQALGLAGSTAVLRSLPLPTPAFVERELDGRSPMADYYRGLAAYRRGRYREAIPALRRAAREAPLAWARAGSLDLSARSAYHLQDWQQVVVSARGVEPMAIDLAIMVGESLVRSGEADEGLALLERIAEGEPEIEGLAGLIAELRLEAAARPQTPPAPRHAAVPPP